MANNNTTTASTNPYGQATGVAALTCKKGAKAPAFTPVAPKLADLNELVNKCKALVPEDKYEELKLHRTYRNTTKSLRDFAMAGIENADADAATWGKVCEAYGNLVVMLESKALVRNETFAKCLRSQLYALRKGLEKLATLVAKPQAVDKAPAKAKASTGKFDVDALVKLASLDADKLNLLLALAEKLG